MTLSNTPVDILCLSETKLDNSIRDSEILIHGYNLISRKDRSRHGRGVACYVKSSLTAIDKSSEVPNDLELTWTEIKTQSTKPFLIGSIYRPPGHPSPRWLTPVENSISDNINTYKELYILGDFNLDPSKHAASPLLNLETDIGLKQLISDHTRVTAYP